MVTQIEDPQVVLRELLDAEYTPANTDGWVDSGTTPELDPHVSTGWYSPGENTTQITCTDQEESESSGGVTGFSGWDPTGGGPIKDMDGTVTVRVWAAEDLLRDVSGTNGKKWTWQASQEIHRIVAANYDIALHASVTAPNYEWISWLDRRREPPSSPDVPDDIPRMACLIGYGYKDTP